MQREGTFREMKLRRSYEKPSERRVREKGRCDPPMSEGDAQTARARGLLIGRIGGKSGKPPVVKGASKLAAKIFPSLQDFVDAQTELPL